MFRSILGFAVLAVLAWLGLKLIFGILGSLVGLAMTVLWLAFIGFVVYLPLRLISPRTPDRVPDMIKARPPAPPAAPPDPGPPHAPPPLSPPPPPPPPH